ncbi:hypothetical protein LMG7974_01819 [Campylobacter majalis]|uniref:Uncharacterized protein n=1 Tax=Campylobacter majalis TaxID=2790656 RepID=A0ABM8Q9R9_9BACT|nr:hypothetical protein LMG7974_01819 [Campylobacter majalis]
MKFINQLITLFISLNLIISQALFANLSPNLNLNICKNKQILSSQIIRI